MSNPKFAWSTSRAALLRECPRAYFWNYYGSWEGWRNPRTGDVVGAFRRKAYCLKQIVPVAIVFGGAVHDALAARLRNGTGFSGIAAEVQSVLHDAFVSSADEAAWLRAPKKLTMLSEVYMGGIKNYPKVVEETKEKLARLDNVPSCKTVGDIEGAEILEIDEDPFNTDFGITAVEGVPAYARIDLLYKKDGKFYVVDWKTSTDSDIRRYKNQIRFYAYYVEKKYGAKAEEIVCRVENVVTNTHEEFAVTQEEIDAIVAGAKKSIVIMSKYVENGDLNNNAPLNSREFPMNKTGRCKRCHFAEFCFNKRGHEVVL